MKGQEDPTKTMITILTLAVIVTGVLAIFFTCMYYKIIVNQSEGERQAYILGNSLLSSECFTYSGKKAVLYENKLISPEIYCFNYSYGLVNVELLDDPTENWEIVIGNTDFDVVANFIIAVKLQSGEIKPALMTVKV